MKYWLHPEAENDLRDAAEFYRKHADIALSQALLAEFEHAMHLLLKHPRVDAQWRISEGLRPKRVASPLTFHPLTSRISFNTGCRWNSL